MDGDGPDGATQFYPTVEEVVGIHDRIVSDDPHSESGIRDRGAIEFVLDYVEHGQFGQGPNTVHEKAFQRSGSAESPCSRSERSEAE